LTQHRVEKPLDEQPVATRLAGLIFPFYVIFYKWLLFPDPLIFRIHDQFVKFRLFSGPIPPLISVFIVLKQPSSPQRPRRHFMKIKALLLFLIFSSIAAFSDGIAREKPRLGILRFTNHSSAAWWNGGVGTDLQDMLIAELASTDSFRVLERKELDAVLDEQDLGASGRINPRTRSKLGKITGAKYLVAATVSAFEQNTSGGGGGLSFQGISLGGRQDKAYMAVDLKVIDVETGEIYDARTVEATSKSSGISVGVHRGDFGGHLGQYKNTPVGKAIRGCIIEIADYLKCSLVEGKNSDCMDEYRQKEHKRREKTKGSIDLE
jgi:curli biogenesis system outer membrane secretion channel CsgG